MFRIAKFNVFDFDSRQPVLVPDGYCTNQE